MPNQVRVPVSLDMRMARHTRRVASLPVNVVVRGQEVTHVLSVHAGTAEPLRVSPPEAVAYPLELARIWRTNDRGHEVLAAEGYEVARTCGAPDGDGAWSERVLVVRSPMHATQQAAGLEKRLCHAETQLTALTPPRGRGKRQITDEATLVEAIARVLTAHRVEGLLSVVWVKQVEQTTHYVGRGRGAENREKRVTENIRYL